MIDNDNFDCIVQDGIRFLESITRYYGPDKGIEVWESMGHAMGRDIQGQVFFTMLTGERSDRVYIEQGTANNGVWAIKAIRGGTGMGLKEAKDAWDLCKYQKVSLTTNSRENKREMIKTLRDMGMIVS